jgi:hypothetical protein
MMTIIQCVTCQWQPHVLHAATAFLRLIEVLPLSIPYYTLAAVPHCKCLELRSPIQRWATDQADQVCYLLVDLSPLIPQLFIVDDRHGDNPTTTPNPPEQGESNFGDSSGPFFDIYSKAAEDEDNKRAEHWQKDAEGIIIFVSPSVDIHTLHI